MSRRNWPMFLGPEQAPLVGKGYSLATASRLDDEVKELITERAGGVRELLTNNRGLLESVAVELLKAEVMESNAFYRLVESHRSSTPPSLD
jgi:ATP-dependent Zn protease